jgi:transposase
VFKGLTDFAWLTIELLLPGKPRGVQGGDDRKVLNGIYWELRTNPPWAEIPKRYGPPITLRPFRALAEARRLGSHLFRQSWPPDGGLQMVSSSSIRVHQHGANFKGGLRRERRPCGPRAHARSRGGLTTETHPRPMWLLYTSDVGRKPPLRYSWSGPKC